MADSYLIKLLSEDGSIYRPILVGYWKPATTPTANTYYSGTYRDEYPSYVSIGSVLNGQLFSVPATDDAATNIDVIWNIIESNYQIKFNIRHGQGNNTYVVKVYFYNDGGSQLSESPDFTLYTSDSGYLSYFSLLLYPNTFGGDVTAITYFGFCTLSVFRPTLDIEDECKYKMYGHSLLPFDTIFGGVSVAPSYPSGGYEPVDVFGGDYNNFDGSSDDIAVPTVIEGAIDNGLVKSYLISPAQLNTMMADLTNFDNTTLTNFLDHLSKLYNSPIDAIISIKKFCIDFSEVPIGSAENVYLLTYQTSATANPITSQYTRIDVGSIDIAEFFGGFLDYPPYTRCTIYLPFIGEKELNVQEIMDSTIHLYYMVDFLTGNCVAHLNVEKSAGETTLNSDLYQWEGNMACDVPLTATDLHQMLGDFFKNGFSALASGATGNIGGILDGIGGAFGAANTGKVMSGGISGSSALMGVRVPYIKIENPIQTVPENFQALRGLAGNINHTIGDLSGFLRCREVDINNITATDDEKAELYALLTGGIFI